MMIGLGTDMVRISRMEKLLERFGSRATMRLFSQEEQEFCTLRPKKSSTYAKMFAAKEACSKALGTGLWRSGVGWRDIVIEHTSSGQPFLSLRGGAKECLETLTPSGYQAVLHLSLTDALPFACATVMLSCSLIGEKHVFVD